MIKKVVIPAAGKGTRMLHLAKNKSKVLINVNNKPFLYYLLENIKKAGIEEVTIVTGYKEEKIREFLKDYNIKANLVNQFEKLGTEEYGTLCPLKCIKDQMDEGEEFITLYGDNLYSPEDLVALKNKDGFNYVGGYKSKNPEKYGVLFSKNGDNKLDKIVEKPKEFVGDLVNTGLYKFTSDVFDTIPNIKKSERGEYELTDAISCLADEGKVKIKQVKYWLDFGNPGDIIKMSKFLKENES